MDHKLFGYCWRSVGEKTALSPSPEAALPGWGRSGLKLSMLQSASPSDPFLPLRRELELKHLEDKVSVPPKLPTAPQPLSMTSCSVTLSELEGFIEAGWLCFSTFFPIYERSLERFRGMPQRAGLISARVNRNLRVPFFHHLITS